MFSPQRQSSNVHCILKSNHLTLNFPNTLQSERETSNIHQPPFENFNSSGGQGEHLESKQDRQNEMNC